MSDLALRRLRGLGAEQPSRAADLSLLAPVERETLLDQVYAQLCRAMMAGRFLPGQALTLRSVSEALGVSQMPVRGALQRLEAAGALGVPDHRRTLVVPELRAQQLQELRDVRIELEGLAAERAAAAITAGELAVVERQSALLEAAAQRGDVEAYIVENWIFHATVYRASRMDQLLALIEGLWLRVGPYVRLMMPDRDSMVASIPNHRAVFEALARKDGAAARSGIAADIRQSAARLLDLLER